MFHRTHLMLQHESADTADTRSGPIRNGNAARWGFCPTRRFGTAAR